MKHVTVTVQPGETLGSIASEFGVKHQDIVTYNNGMTVAGRSFTATNIQAGDQFYVRVNSFSTETLNNSMAQTRRNEREQAMQERRAQQQQRTAQNTNTPDAVAGQSSCDETYVDLVHLSRQTADGGKIEHHFIPLTAHEVAEFEQEEQMVAGLINDFYDGLNSISSTDTQIINTSKQELFGRMIEATSDRERYGDIFEAATPRYDENGNKIPQGEPDPTQLLEIKRLGSMASASFCGGSKVELQDPPGLMSSSNANRTSATDQIIAFNYVRGARFRDMIEQRYYRVQPANNASWYDSNANQVDTSKLLEEITNLRNTKFDPKIEAKLECTHQFINQAAFEWKDNTDWPLPSIHANINVEREAQVFRLAANAAAGCSYNPLDQTFVLAAKLQAQFDLISGKATTTFSWPADELSHITYQYGKVEQDTVDFGCFQFKLALEVSGFAGASGMIGADIQVDMSAGMPQLRGSSDFPGSPPGAQGGVEAFVGIRAGCKVDGGIRWQDTLDTNDWKDMASVGLGAEGYVGGTFVAKIHVAYYDGKFFLRCKAGAAWGVGASGEIAGTVNVDNIGTMAHFVYNSLLKVDFSKVEWIAPDAFVKLSLIGVALVAKGLDWTISQVQSVWQSLQDGWRDLSSFIELLFSDWNEEKSAFLGLNISADVRKGARSVILHLPPEGKGQLLWKLIYTNVMNIRNRLGEEAVNGIFDLLSACQSLEEYNLVYACMNEQGTLAPGDSRERVIRENKKKVAEFIARSHRSNESFDPTYRRRLLTFDQAVIKNIDVLENLLAANAAPIPDCPVQFNRCIVPNQLAMLRNNNYDYYA